MRNFQTQINKKVYYTVVLISIVLMIIGLLFNNSIDISFLLHGLLIIVLVACLLLYPKYENHILRLIIMIVAFAYFYTIFFLYPETWSTFIFLCFIPAISILFFDSKLFYFSLILNGTIDNGYIWLYYDSRSIYIPISKQDLIGNIINFIGSQVIIYFIFYLSHGRIKKQQLYYEQITTYRTFKDNWSISSCCCT